MNFIRAPLKPLLFSFCFSRSSWMESPWLCAPAVPWKWMGFLSSTVLDLCRAGLEKSRGVQGHKAKRCHKQQVFSFGYLPHFFTSMEQRTRSAFYATFSTSSVLLKRQGEISYLVYIFYWGVKGFSTCTTVGCHLYLFS